MIGFFDAEGAEFGGRSRRHKKSSRELGPRLVVFCVSLLLLLRFRPQRFASWQRGVTNTPPTSGAENAVYIAGGGEFHASP
jgi:hypothetical protein